MGIRRWVTVAAKIGALIGLGWGLFYSQGDLRVLAVFMVLGALPGAVGGAVMAYLAPKLPNVAARVVVGALMGGMIGLFCGVAPFTPGYYIFTAPSGVVGGMITVLVFEYSER